MKNFNFRHKLISKLQGINIIGIRAVANIIPKFLIPPPKSKLVIDTIHDFKIEIDPVNDVAVEQSLYYTGTYERGTLFVMESFLKDGNIFVDVGANIGLMTIFSSRIVGEDGKIYAFEPNPKTLEILKRNIKLNGLENIEVSDFAIGHEANTGKIYDQWESGRGSASLIKPSYETESSQIKITTLTNFLINKVDRLDLLKIDIEGYELSALKGAKDIIEKMFPALIIESSDGRENFENSSTKELFSYVLTLKKYRLFKLSGTKSRKSKLQEIKMLDNLPSHDNIFCFGDHHLELMPKNIFK